VPSGQDESLVIRCNHVPAMNHYLTKILTSASTYCSTLARRTNTLHKANLAKDLQCKAVLYNIIQLLKETFYKKVEPSKLIVIKIYYLFCTIDFYSTDSSPPEGCVLLF